MFTDIKNSDQFETVQKVAKGWSSDEKYFIQTREQQRLLLRVSDVAHGYLYSIKWAKFGDRKLTAPRSAASRPLMIMKRF